MSIEHAIERKPGVAVASRLAAAVFLASLAVSGAAAQAPAPVLGSVQLPRTVRADGKSLPPGTYQLRLADPIAPGAGQSPDGERWIEFLQRGRVVGREVATVVGSDAIGAIAKGPRPRPDGWRVDLLKGGDYVRLWINRAGTNYLINMPPT